MAAGWNPVFFSKSTSFTSSIFPIQPDFSQNLPAAIYTKYQFSPDIAQVDKYGQSADYSLKSYILNKEKVVEVLHGYLV